MFLKNISKFISNYRYEQATVESITTVKAAFLDFFGVTYRGANEEASNIAFNTVEEIFSGTINLNLKASVIGRITGENHRIIKNGEEHRYLDLPQADEIYKMKF